MALPLQPLSDSQPNDKVSKQGQDRISLFGFIFPSH